MIPIGPFKLALVPIPSDRPAEPVPARVVTSPDEITICLTRCPLYSVTNRFVPSVVIPQGNLKLAAVPVPFDDPLQIMYIHMRGALKPVLIHYVLGRPRM